MNFASFAVEDFGGEEVLEMLKDSQLLPGNIVKLYRSDEENKNIEIYEVKKVIFSKKSKVSITLRNSKPLNGRLLNPSSTILS